MEEVKKRRQLKPEEKLQIYKEATVARAQGNGSVAEVLRRWGIHSSDLTRITKTVEEGAIGLGCRLGCRVYTIHCPYPLTVPVSFLPAIV